MIKKYLILFTFFFAGGLLMLPLNSQNKVKTDSLLHILNSTQLSDSNRLYIYFELAKNHPNSREALLYGEKMLKLAKRLDYPVMIARALTEISNNQRLLGNSVAAYNAIFEAIKIYDKINYSKGKAILYSILGTNYGIDKNYELSKKYFKNALYEFNKINEIKQASMVTINLGETYRYLNEFDSAKICFRLVLLTTKNTNDDLLKGYALGNLGLVYSALGMIDSADYELSSAIALLEKLGDAYSVSIYMLELALIYESEGNILAAEMEMLKALELAKTNGLKEQIRDISIKLADFYAHQGNFKSALVFQRIYQIYQDSLVNRKNIEQTEQLKNRYELEKKETEIDLLNEVNRNQRLITYGSSFGAFLFLILAFLLYRNYQRTRRDNRTLQIQKTVIEKREEEKALLLKELNHRVKNNLQMVSSLLSLQSHQLKDHPAAEAIKAGRYRVEAMSLIHQKLYQKDHHTRIQLKDYVEELVRNLMYSSGKKTELIFTLEDHAVDINIAIPIALIVNELVTNAFKYAFGNTEHAVLEINLYKQDNLLNLFIKDNGIGILKLDDPQEYSFGLKLVNSLVDQIDGTIEQYNEDGSCWHLKLKITD